MTKSLLAILVSALFSGLLPMMVSAQQIEQKTSVESQGESIYDRECQVVGGSDKGSEGHYDTARVVCTRRAPNSADVRSGRGPSNTQFSKEDDVAGYGPSYRTFDEESYDGPMETSDPGK